MTSAGSNAPRGGGAGFYQTVWRWHFYAGLFVIPFVVMLCVTGSIYLFKPQLNAMMYADRMFVVPQAASVSYGEQLAAARAALPDASAAAFRPAPAPDRSSEVDLIDGHGRMFTYFVDPHDGAVLGRRDGDYNLQEIAVKLHGELMIGPVGDYLIELATCWALVLVVTGVYLWWPRGVASVWGTLLPRLRSANRRIFWRDLHAMAGIYGAILIGFMILSGLPWAGFWGEALMKITARYPAAMVAAPESAVPTATLNRASDKTVSWAAGNLPMPNSMPGGHAGHGASQAPLEPETSQEGIRPGTPVNLDSVIDFARERGVASGFKVGLPQGATGVYTISTSPDDPRQEVAIHVDQYSGRVLSLSDWSQYGIVPKVVSTAVVLHEGRMFGLANQLLMLFAVLALLTLCITSVVMWWRRRPQGRLGAPPMPTNVRVWKGAVVLLVVMGLFLPLMGASLLLVLLFDRLVVARSARLRHALN